MAEKMNLHQKLVEIRKDIGGFTKDAKSYNYQYVSGSQVLSKIQGKMNELGVLLIPEIVTQEFQEHAYKDKYSKDKLDFIVHGGMSYTWVNADDPDDYIKIPFYYTGQQDDISKAFGSGLTYSERYFIIKFFNLPTDADDPDGKDSSGRTQQKESKPAANQNVVTPTQIKSISAKVKAISDKSGKSQLDVYKGAQEALGIQKSTRELNKSEASKVIDYLANLE